MSAKDVKPTLTDYLAGAILANGFVWLWTLILYQFSDFFIGLPATFVADFSLIIYLSGGTLASYLVCRRSASRSVVTGLKLSVAAWLFSLVMAPSIVDLSAGLVLSLLMCFLAGGVVGSYLALRRKLSQS